MEALVCGHNGFGQLKVKKLKQFHDKLLDVLTGEVDNSKVDESYHAKPVPHLSLLKHVNTSNDCIDVSFTWSRCITNIKTSKKNTILVTGFNTDKESSEFVLENVQCSATTDKCVLLTETNALDKMSGLYDGMSQPFAVSIRSNEENPASVVKVQCLAGGHKDFYSVYDNINFGVFKVSEDSAEEKNDEKCPDMCDMQVRVHHIDCTVPIKEISCGKEHVLLLSVSGNVYSHGLSSRGQLGHGEIENKSSPTLIEALDGLTVKTVVAGGWHSCALSDIDDLYVWGWNESGQLGLGSPETGSGCDKEQRVEGGVGIVAVPTCADVPGGEDIVGVACGSRHTVALTESGQVYTCGWNGYGQLGLGDTRSRDALTKVDGLTGCIKVFAGHWNSAFLCKKE